jgi:hypothetical protein
MVLYLQVKPEPTWAAPLYVLAANLGLNASFLVRILSLFYLAASDEEKCLKPRRQFDDNDLI